MLNVLSPSLALDVDERVQCRPLEVDHDIRRLVAGLIQKRIVFRPDSAARMVLDWP